ncbi:MAG: histidine triad nucleotide-binding protein [Candidatus Obscuribacterales bacterium]|nr:histidine triad nucleotide-binding protein [Candidatus Obscuribacterales bacterium]
MTENTDCLFCKIIQRQIPATIVSESEDYLAIRDINPQASTHILIMPKVHVQNIACFDQADKLGALFIAAKKLAELEKLTNGFRLVVNNGPDAGQSVDHLHIHLLGGRALGWPPG